MKNSRWPVFALVTGIIIVCVLVIAGIVWNKTRSVSEKATTEAKNDGFDEKGSVVTEVTDTPTPEPTATNTPTPEPTATDTPTPEPTPAVGIRDTFVFGSYEQDGNTKNGKEEIEWIVLDKSGSGILLISKYALDCQPYNTEYKSVTWEKCTLRSWLNNDFLNTAFDDDEQDKILTTNVINNANPNYSTTGGNDTQDKVFLLSISEAKRYFASEKDRRCKPTASAIENGTYIYSVGFSWWWLRSPGFYSSSAASVNSYGNVLPSGYVNFGSVAIRPALWINLES